jgi:hypothetical protein
VNPIFRAFHDEELPEDASPSAIQSALVVGRELEAVARPAGPAMSTDFVDRVMASIAVEPAPAPAIVAAQALRAGRLRVLLSAVRDAWLVVASGPRPASARAQSLALVLVAFLMLAATVGLGAGAAGWLAPRVPPPVAPTTPIVAPTPSEVPTRPQTPSRPSSAPTEGDASSETPEPSVKPTPSKTTSPRDNSDGGSDHGGSGVGESGGESEGSSSGPTAEPSESDG